MLFGDIERIAAHTALILCRDAAAVEAQIGRAPGHHGIGLLIGRLQVQRRCVHHPAQLEKSTSAGLHTRPNAEHRAALAPFDVREMGILVGPELPVTGFARG
jgi:hypothetical protein